jgi:hypothetical protein
MCLSKILGRRTARGKAGEALLRMMESQDSQIYDFFLNGMPAGGLFEAVRQAPSGYRLRRFETLRDGTRRPLEVVRFSGEEVLERWQVTYASSASGWQVRKLTEVDQAYARVMPAGNAKGTPSFTLRRVPNEETGELP